jgi:hypothetical protein
MRKLLKVILHLVKRDTQCVGCAAYIDHRAVITLADPVGNI